MLRIIGIAVGGTALALILAAVLWYGPKQYRAGANSRQPTIDKLHASLASASDALVAADQAAIKAQEQARAQKARAAQLERSLDATLALQTAKDADWTKRLANARKAEVPGKCPPVLEMRLPASVMSTY